GNSRATAIGIVAPTDAHDAASALSVTVTGLPTDGTIFLADGSTPVALKEPLSVAQLTGLEFKPTADLFGQSSTFTYSVTDAAGNTANSIATLAIQNRNPTPPTTSPGSTPTPSPSPAPADIGLLDTTTGQTISVTASSYSGPVTGLQRQFVYT